MKESDKMRKIPYGQINFETVIKNNLLYIDKTNNKETLQDMQNKFAQKVKYGAERFIARYNIKCDFEENLTLAQIIYNEMEQYYNGYRFSEKSEERTFNLTLVRYYFEIEINL